MEATRDATRDLLARVSSKYTLQTDYQVAKFLGISRQRMSKYKSGAATMGEEIALKVADALALPHAYVLACIAAERTKNKAVQKAWQEAAAVIRLASNQTPINAETISSIVYYVKWLASLALAFAQSRQACIMS